MGISTLQSYRGAQVFEAIGLNNSLVEKYFTGTGVAHRGRGPGRARSRGQAQARLRLPAATESETELSVGGSYAYRVRGEHHLVNPLTIAKLQHAVRQSSYQTYKEYSALVNDQSRNLCTLRGLIDIRVNPRPIPLEEVEPAAEIVKRFATGAMSYGSIGKEAHETVAIAMNRIGGRSNTGEGGEDEARFRPDANGDSRRSSIKQVPRAASASPPTTW